MANINQILSNLLIRIIKGYQLVLSKVMHFCCRFEPSCSTYAVEAIRAHGWLKGSYLALRRLLRCHPWHPGGNDPVP